MILIYFLLQKDIYLCAIDNIRKNFNTKYFLSEKYIKITKLVKKIPF